MATHAERKDILQQSIEYFSDWQKLKVSIAVLLKVKLILKVKVLQRKNPGVCVVNNAHTIMSSDLLDAETAIIKWLQARSFPDEVAHLSQGGEDAQRKVPKMSKLRSLDPFMDDGVLKVGGHTRRVSVSIGMKHQIILPKRSHITKLIIRNEHSLLAHAGRNHVLRNL